MRLEKTRNTAVNFAWGILNKVIALVFPFVIRTAIIKTLGADYLGLNSLFSSILQVLSISELGISSAIVYSMYKPIAEDDAKEICALMNLYKKVYRIIAVFVLVAGILIMPFLDKLIKGVPDVDINIYYLYLIYLFNTVLSYSMFAYKTSLFTAHQRNSVVFKVQSGAALLQYVIQIVSVVVFKDYYLYVVALLVMTIVSNLILSKKADKQYPNYKPQGSISDDTKNGMKRQILGLVIGKVNVTARTTLDSVFISSMLGLTMSAIYSNYFYIVSSVVAILTILSTSMTAGVGNSIVTDDIEKNYNLFNNLTFASRWMVGVLGICILCSIQSFMELWVGQELMLKDIMAFICAAYFIVGQSGMIRGVFNEALGLWWELRWYSIIDIPINLFMNIYFTSRWGVYGTVLATVLCIFTYGIPISSYVLFKNYFGKNRFKRYMMENLGFVLITMIIGAGCFMICNMIPLNGIVKFIVCGMIGFIVSNLLFFLYARKKQEYYFMIGLLKKMVHKVLKK